MDWLLKHKLLALGIIVLVTIFAWYMLSGSPSSPDAVLATETVQQMPPEAQDLINSLVALQAVTLQGTVFSDSSFQLLKDFSTPITPEPVGRTNPFTPFSPVSVSAAPATPASSATH